MSHLWLFWAPNSSHKWDNLRTEWDNTRAEGDEGCQALRRRGVETAQAEPKRSVAARRARAIPGSLAA